MGIAAATEAMATALFGWAELRASLEPLWPGRDKESNRIRRRLGLTDRLSRIHRLCRTS